MSKITRHNTVVFGVSADTVESHKGFAAKEHLNFPLLADPDKKMIAAYGVLNKAGYADRVTFVIGPDGKIRQIDRSVNAEFSREGSTLTSRHGTDLALMVSNWRAQVGKPVPNFSLIGYDGQSIPLFPPGKKAVVVLFLSARSAASHAYAGRIDALASDPAYKDVAFVGIDPNSDETSAEVKAAVERDKYPFPIGQDVNREMARRFSVSVLPSVWVLNGRGIAVYHGGIDDSIDPSQAKVGYLKEALDATLAAKPVVAAETRAVGDPLRRSAKH